jgi:hypothetical protein
VTDYEGILKSILSDPRYRKNILWGEPRPGHPEGTIQAHIQHLEENLERLRPKLAPEEYWRLKVLIHVHDTFKAEAPEGIPIHSADSHASLGRQFLAGFCSDSEMLAMQQFHDESFALYQRVKYGRGLDRRRLKQLLQAIHDWDTFLAFLIIDGGSPGKSPEPVLWFLRKIEGKVQTRWTKADVIDRSRDC